MLQKHPFTPNTTLCGAQKQELTVLWFSPGLQIQQALDFPWPGQSKTWGFKIWRCNWVYEGSKRKARQPAAVKLERVARFRNKTVELFFAPSRVHVSQVVTSRLATPRPHLFADHRLPASQFLPSSASTTLKTPGRNSQALSLTACESVAGASGSTISGAPASSESPCLRGLWDVITGLELHCKDKQGKH